ncbi:MAG: glycoside hydrolase family 95-like protein, partial [Phycisphaerae bacterium]
FGGTAGIAEMLLQSHDSEILLLPALPKAWPIGHVHGLKARGGFVVDVEWAGGRLAAGRIRSSAGRPCRVTCGVPLDITSEGRAIEVRRVGTSTAEFPTEPGQTYDLKAR